MATRTQDPAVYYVWEVSGHPVVVHLRLDVVDRLAAEVMRGFGSVPKRGAEVGGILIGTILPGIPAIVQIDDIEPVACEYRRGPSYLFTAVDGAALEESWRQLQPSATPSAYAVGYFRSHTREGFSLTPEDLEILDRYFPALAQVALLIQPYASKVSVGGFFVRERGEFSKRSPLEFPLQRRELSGEEPAPRRSLTEGRTEGRPERPPRVSRGNLESPPSGILGLSGTQAVPPVNVSSPSASPSLRKGWMGPPLILLFTLLGGLLGYQLAVIMRVRSTTLAAPDLALSLSVEKSGENLRLNWSRLAPAVRSAQRGVLEIDDGGYTRPVTLDAAQLQNGSLIYRSLSNSVRFRMTVYPQARVSVVETLEWKQ